MRYCLFGQALCKILPIHFKFSVTFFILGRKSAVPAIDFGAFPLHCRLPVEPKYSKLHIYMPYCLVKHCVKFKWFILSSCNLFFIVGRKSESNRAVAAGIAISAPFSFTTGSVACQITPNCTFICGIIWSSTVLNFSVSF